MLATLRKIPSPLFNMVVSAMLRKERKTTLGNDKRDTELARFDQMADAWWDPDGAFKHVLAFNAARLDVIREFILQHQQASVHASSEETDGQLQGLRVLDIGCGGGLLSEALAAQGAEVTGIDGSEVSIQVAKAHAAKSGVQVTYLHMLAEELLDQGLEPFDVVLNTEVIEHVEDQQGLIDTCCALCKDDGLLILATLNRTVKSWLFGIVGAEYVLRLLPRGTHEWRYFVKPDEIKGMLKPHHFSPKALRGLEFNPFNKHWRVTDNCKVNYLLSATRSESS